MARPPLAVGTYGNIQTKRVPGGYEARARFRDFDGVTREVRRARPTADAARNALRAELTDRSAPSSSEITARTKLDVLLELFIAEKFGGLRDGSRKRYRAVIDLHIRPALGALSIIELTTGRLDRFLKGLQGPNGEGSGVAKHAKTVLSQALDIAVRYDVLRFNPVAGVAGGTVTRKKETRALTPDEVAAAGRAILDWQAGKDRKPGQPGAPRTQDLYAVYVTALSTAGRIGEVLALRWQDIDWEAKTVHLCGTVYRPEGKGKPMTRQDETKTGKDLVVDLPPTCLSVLWDLRTSQPANIHNAVFPSQNGTWRDPANLRNTLKKIFVPAGLDGVTPHVFRSTAATHLNDELNLDDASKQLGHADTTITAKHYVKQTNRGPAVSEAIEHLLAGL